MTGKAQYALRTGKDMAIQTVATATGTTARAAFPTGFSRPLTGSSQERLNVPMATGKISPNEEVLKGPIPAATAAVVAE